MRKGAEWAKLWLQKEGEKKTDGIARPSLTSVGIAPALAPC